MTASEKDELYMSLVMTGILSGFCSVWAIHFVNLKSLKIEIERDGENVTFRVLGSLLFLIYSLPF